MTCPHIVIFWTPDFDQCAEEAVGEHLSNHFNCTLPFVNSVKGLSICDTIEIASKVKISHQL